jgi:hypothetical protein
VGSEKLERGSGDENFYSHFGLGSTAQGSDQSRHQRS